MPTNLRLRSELADAVKTAAARAGRSQQDIMRDAIERYVLADEPPHEAATSDLLPPRTPWRRTERRIRLPEGTTTSDLLDRDDRI